MRKLELVGFPAAVLALTPPSPVRAQDSVPVVPGHVDADVRFSGMREVALVLADATSPAAADSIVRVLAGRGVAVRHIVGEGVLIANVPAGFGFHTLTLAIARDSVPGVRGIFPSATAASALAGAPPQAREYVQTAVDAIGRIVAMRSAPPPPTNLADLEEGVEERARRIGPGRIRRSDDPAPPPVQPPPNRDDGAGLGFGVFDWEEAAGAVGEGRPKTGFTALSTASHSLMVSYEPKFVFDKVAVGIRYIQGLSSSVIPTLRVRTITGMDAYLETNPESGVVVSYAEQTGVPEPGDDATDADWDGNCESDSNCPSVVCLMRDPSLAFDGSSATFAFDAYTSFHWAWNDNDGDLAPMVVDPGSNEAYALEVYNVMLGDLVRIYSSAGQLKRRIAVTAKNSAPCPASTTYCQAGKSYLLWEGFQEDYSTRWVSGVFIVNVYRNNALAHQYNAAMSPASSYPVIESVSTTDNRLSFQLKSRRFDDGSYVGRGAWLLVRILDGAGAEVTRPANHDFSPVAGYSYDLSGLRDGTYTATVFAWRPGGPDASVHTEITISAPPPPPPPGPLAASISGPTTIEPFVNYTWTALVSGGVTPYTYEWLRTEFGSTNQVSTSSSYTGSAASCDGFTLRLNVWSTDGQFQTDVESISVQPPPGTNCIEPHRVIAVGDGVPDTLELAQAVTTPTSPASGLQRVSVQIVGAAGGPEAESLNAALYGIRALNIGLPAAVRGQRVVVQVFDVAGRPVRSLVDDRAEPGRYHVVWDGEDARGRRVAPGVYVAVVRIGASTRTTKLVVTGR